MIHRDLIDAWIWRITVVTHGPIACASRSEACGRSRRRFITGAFAPDGEKLSVLFPLLRSGGNLTALARRMAAKCGDRPHVASA